MKDPKAIRKAIMTAKSVARLIDPHFGRVPLPEIGGFGSDKPFEEHSPMVHASYGEPMPEHFAGGGYAEGGSPENTYAQPDETGLYSHAANVASQLPQELGTPEQFKGMLLNKGVKPDEFKWSEYDHAFGDKPQVTRDEVARRFWVNKPDIQEKVFSQRGKHLRDEAHNRHVLEERKINQEYPHGANIYDGSPENEEYLKKRYEMRRRHDRELKELPAGDPFHEEYTIPGGENYRELLLTHGDGEGGFEGVNGHFGGEAGILASLRMKDRHDTQGNKVLHLDELQSDWGQQARKHGYKDPERVRLATAKARVANEVFQEANAGDDTDAYLSAREARNQAWKELDSARQGVDPAPYVGKTNDWVDLGLKRALLEAVKGGHDKLAWSPGDVQADRYDLSKHIGEIRHEKNDDGTYNLDITDPRGGPVLYKENIPAEKMSEHVGKEMAEKIFAGHGDKDEDPGYRDWRSLRGLDLKVGGEGMRHFYDDLLPKRLLKLAKQHDPDANLHQILIDHPKEHGDDGGWGLAPEQADTLLPALHITPRMRESILKHGFRAFAGGGEVEEHTGADLMSRDPSLAEAPPQMEKGFAGNPAKPLGEMSARYRRIGQMDPWREKHPERLVEEGAILFPALHDLTMADREITHIGEHELDRPVELQGGAEYQRTPKRGAWASREQTAKTVANKMVKQNPEGRPAYMIGTTMGLPASDSSHMMVQAVMRMIPHMEISSKAAAAFDAEMRKTDPAWPGILKHEKAEAHLLRKDAKGGKDYVGTRVSNFIKSLDKAGWRNWGFPGLGESRFAISDKRLLGAPQLSTGFSMSRVSPERGIYSDPEDPHGTYSGIYHRGEGKDAGYAGGFRHIVPASSTFLKWFKSQPEMFYRKKTGEHLPITKTMLQQALLTQHPGQVADQEWLDAVMPEYEKGKKWGWKSGGTVKRALMIAKGIKKK